MSNDNEKKKWTPEDRREHFKKIRSNGRVKGSKNKVPLIVKEAFARLLEDNIDNMGTWLHQVAADNPEKALDILLKISERFVPKLSQQQITNANGEELLKGLTFNFGVLNPTVEDVKHVDLTDQKLIDDPDTPDSTV